MLLKQLNFILIFTLNYIFITGNVAQLVQFLPNMHTLKFLSLKSISGKGFIGG